VSEEYSALLSRLDAAVARSQGASGELRQDGWQCAARKQALPEPADCNWPFCDCDPYASKVITAIEEAGFPLGARTPPESDALRGHSWELGRCFGGSPDAALWAPDRGSPRLGGEGISAVRGTVLSLCDRTGHMVQPWLEAGYEAITVDLQEQINPHPRRLHLVDNVALLVPWVDEIHKSHRVIMAFAFPPCTDLAVSGARWFKDKGLDGLIGALGVVNACKKICEASGAPWMLENPVSTIATYWREPDHTFHPADFTGFELGDNYTKKTCLWVGGGFRMPKPKPDMSLPPPDDRIHKAAPGPDRADFRSATPLGFARAVFHANALALTPQEQRGAVE
jgi:hypothetical protein